MRRRQTAAPRAAQVPDSDDPPTNDLADGVDTVQVAPVVITTVICALAAVVGHVMLGLNFRYGWLPWQPIAGASVSLVAVTAFGGFYLASRRARVAITASFLLTFLVLLTYVVTIEEVASVTDGQQGLVTDFRVVVQTIVGFYFGTEAVVAVSKVLGVARSGGTPAAVRRADRDLV